MFKVAVVVVLFLLSADVAWAKPVRVASLPFSCEQVRAYVQQAGMARAQALAASYGLSAAQLRAARRCLER